MFKKFAKSNKRKYTFYTLRGEDKQFKTIAAIERHLAHLSEEKLNELNHTLIDMYEVTYRGNIYDCCDNDYSVNGKNVVDGYSVWSAQQGDDHFPATAPTLREAISCISNNDTLPSHHRGAAVGNTLFNLDVTGVDDDGHSWQIDKIIVSLNEEDDYHVTRNCGDNDCYIYVSNVDAAKAEHPAFAPYFKKA